MFLISKIYMRGYKYNIRNFLVYIFILSGYWFVSLQAIVLINDEMNSFYLKICLQNIAVNDQTN